MDAFTIKDLENLSGIKAHTIRIWEQRYNFLKPQRTTTNIRYYTNEELRTILNIALLNKYGFKISHIDRMQPTEIQEKILTLVDANAIQERIINDLINAMVSMDLEQFDKTLNNYISAKGLERTITQIIFPFLEKIGMLWLTGHINPAQEHLVSNLIRQKIIVAIDKTITRFNVDKSALLFLPEGEYHELGLLFLHYILKNKGVYVYYLGSNVPLKDALQVYNLKKPDYIFVHLTSTGSNFNFEKFLNNIHSGCGKTPIIISGQLINQFKKIPPPGISFKKSLSDLQEFISSI